MPTAILAVVKQSEKDRTVAEQFLSKILDNGNTEERQEVLNFFTSASIIQDDTLRKVARLLDDPDIGMRILALRVLYPFRQKQFVHDAVRVRAKREDVDRIKVIMDSFLKDYSEPPPTLKVISFCRWREMFVS